VGVEAASEGPSHRGTLKFRLGIDKKEGREGKRGRGGEKREVAGEGTSR